MIPVITIAHGVLDSLDLEVWTKFARDGYFGEWGYSDCLGYNYCNTPLSQLQQMMDQVADNIGTLNYKPIVSNLTLQSKCFEPLLKYLHTFQRNSSCAHTGRGWEK